MDLLHEEAEQVKGHWRPSLAQRFQNLATRVCLHETAKERGLQGNLSAAVCYRIAARDIETILRDWAREERECHSQETRQDKPDRKAA